MEWSDIVKRVRIIRDEFDRSYKCLNIDRPTKEETIHQHMQTLLRCFEDIRVILNVNYNRLTKAHQTAAEGFFLDLKERVFKVAIRKDIKIDLPENLHEEVFIKPSFSQQESRTDKTMSQTVVEFLNSASRLITDFDGKSENLRSFLDSLALVDSIKGSHESTAVSLIKTKLKGTARNLIGNEATIAEIVSKLNSTVKGESVEVLSAKIMNIRQNNKTANAYCTEIENLTKSLENAYISDGLSCELASKYSTQVAVKALTKNCTIDKVKLIMEAGQFNSMNEAVSKFVNSCTEATGQQNAILYYGQRQNNYDRKRNYNRSNNNFVDNHGFRNPNGNGFRNNNNNYNNRNRNRLQRGNNRGNYVRAANLSESDSENQNAPLGSEQ